MENSFLINGGKKLYGEVFVQTSKNGTLPILSACMLSDGEVKLYNLPNIVDVKNMISILSKLGVEIKQDGINFDLDMSKVENSNLDCSLSKTMRSSLFLLGPCLSRFKSLMITTPGGCRIGARPIDIHLKALKKFGVKISSLGDYIFFNAEKAKSCSVKLRLPSVGATENIIQFAVLLKGKTEIYNAAKEPEIVDLCNFLNSMGANINGAGTEKITIYGVEKLNNTQYIPSGDRIVAGTIMIATALCGGSVKIKNTKFNDNEKLINILRLIGCQIETKNDIIILSSSGKLKSFNKIKTGYYPEFATDLQSLMLVLGCKLDKKCFINEKLFENRFLIVKELNKMGAKIKIRSKRKVEINPINEFKGCEVKAEDLRGGAGLVLAGLSALGETKVNNIELVDRGYECFEKVLSNLGADIKRI